MSCSQIRLTGIGMETCPSLALPCRWYTSYRCFRDSTAELQEVRMDVHFLVQEKRKFNWIVLGLLSVVVVVGALVITGIF